MRNKPAWQYDCVSSALRRFAATCLMEGRSPDYIRHALLAQGWPPEAAVDALHSAMRADRG